MATKKGQGNHNPIGFTKPVPISDNLFKFLTNEFPPEKISRMMSRTDVTKLIWEYIISNNLQDENPDIDKKFYRKIKLDEKLKEILLEIPEGKHLTYFNFQKYMKHNYLTPISDKLAEFLEVEPDTAMFRLDAIDKIHKYIEYNKLGIINDKNFKLDEKLRDLLNINKSVEHLTYSKLPIYMKPLFINTEA
jgi:chromatin remodeling complex protein RSC6